MGDNGRVTRNEWIALRVADAPPLTAEQKDKLGLLLRESHERDL